MVAALRLENDREVARCDRPEREIELVPAVRRAADRQWNQRRAAAIDEAAGDRGSRRRGALGADADQQAIGPEEIASGVNRRVGRGQRAAFGWIARAAHDRGEAERRCAGVQGFEGAARAAQLRSRSALAARTRWSREPV